jgi:anti-sigma factor RsiW
MRPDERTVAGLTCSEVMADLSAYLDGELPAERSQQLEAHVAGCQQCATFGSAFANLIAQVRERLGEPARVPDDVLDRLRSALSLRP